ncbi:class I SAM-dependent methyltransferase [bacterium]|nr:MAG: class I SAM-dependent methyltransferase [bacterium]
MNKSNKQFTKQDVKEFWNRNVCQTEFIKGKEEGSLGFFEEAEKIRYKYHFYLPELFDWIATQKPRGKLLEVGCGMGTDLLQLARCGLEVTGIDLTENGIALAQKRFDLYQIPDELKVDDAENLSFNDNSFDIVYSFGVLHHTPDTQKSIDEVYRVLKPGGLAVIMLYHTKSFNYIIHRMLKAPFDGNRKYRCPIERSYTKDEIYKIFQNYKNVQLEIEYFLTTGYGIIWDLIPKYFHRYLGHKWGWHIIIKAEKT